MSHFVDVFIEVLRCYHNCWTFQHGWVIFLTGVKALNREWKAPGTLQRGAARQ